MGVDNYTLKMANIDNWKLTHPYTRCIAKLCNKDEEICACGGDMFAV